MIEALKELVEIVQRLPEMSLWILGGYLFYKLFVTGSIVGAIVTVSKLLINKGHDYLVQPKVKVHISTIDDRFFYPREASQAFYGLIEDIISKTDELEKRRGRSIKSGMFDEFISGKKYMRHSDIDWARQAIHKAYLEEKNQDSGGEDD